jgi:hypothetical protein
MITPLTPLHAKALLKSTINLMPATEEEQESKMIRPATAIQMVVQVENVGDAPSQEAKLFVRFSLPEPLDDQPNSLLYQSEVVKLERLDVGQKKIIAFEKKHMLPPLHDFIGQDWALRRYEAVLVMADKKELVSGTTNLSFTASYYEGLSREIPVSSDGDVGQAKIYIRPQKIKFVN